MAKKVIVIGAELAGLSAASLLAKVDLRLMSLTTPMIQGGPVESLSEKA